MIKLSDTKKIRKLYEYLPMKYMLDFYDENSSWLPDVFKAYSDSTYTNAIVMINHYLFISCNCRKEFINEFFSIVINDELRQRLGVVFLFYDNKVDIIDTKPLSKFEPFVITRYLYKYNDINILNDKITKEVVKIKEISNKLPKNLDIIIEEVESTATYKNFNDYLLNGSGYTFLINNTVMGFCTTEYPSKNAVAFGIMVNDEYQKQGYGKSMALSLIKEIKEINPSKMIYWDCFSRNIASSKTALSCGFERINEYEVIFLPLRAKDE